MYGPNEPRQLRKHHYRNNAHSFTNPNPKIIHKPQATKINPNGTQNHRATMKYSAELLTATVVGLIVHSQLLEIEDSQFGIAQSYETLAETRKPRRRSFLKNVADSASLTQRNKRKIGLKNRIC